MIYMKNLHQLLLFLCHGYCWSMQKWTIVICFMLLYQRTTNSSKVHCSSSQSGTRRKQPMKSVSNITLVIIIPSPTKMRRDIVTLPSVLRNILVNTLESTSLVHTQSLRESGTLLMFKVIGQRSRSPGQICRRGDTPHFALPFSNILF